MKLSVVTSTWNSAAWLADSIASVDVQTWPHVERIFVDGGSTDGTLDMIAAVEGDKKVLHDVRGGISAAMNAGARVATGDVIAHLHSDDIYADADVLAKVARWMSDSDALWLFGRCRSLVDGRQIDNEHPTPRYSYAALLRRNMIPHPSTFYRREAFNAAGGFDESLKYAMDYDLWLKLGRMGDPIQVDDYLAAFRYHAGSLTSRRAWAAHNQTLAVRLRHQGLNPLAIAEHMLRHGVRSWRMWREPPPYAADVPQSR
ncbi:MAG: glycosyltransferase family 2 protein [Hyphomicrobiaceae bacterium]